MPYSSRYLLFLLLFVVLPASGQQVQTQVQPPQEQKPLLDRRGMPIEPDSAFRPADLVELIRLDSTIHLDIRYATSNNFMGQPMYSQARAFLQRPAAEALVRANKRLRKLGYGIAVFDAYRPWSVTRKFWDATPQEKRIYVANPNKGSRHNRGCAVDVSLYDRKTGKEVEMTSPYDDFTERAAAAYEGGTPEQHAMRDLLQRTMRAEGFQILPDEWWHFDYKDWKSYKILDIPFERLGSGKEVQRKDTKGSTSSPQGKAGHKGHKEVTKGTERIVVDVFPAWP